MTRRDWFDSEANREPDGLSNGGGLSFLPAIIFHGTAEASVVVSHYPLSQGGLANPCLLSDA